MIILQAIGVTKRFGGLQALTKVTFDLPEGQILGLIGPNGAGKTTLFNCLNGVYHPEEGKVMFLGQDITQRKTYNVSSMGMARTHGENLSQAAQTAEEVLAFVGLVNRIDQLASSLNVAQKKRLEMARALAARPRLLLLDEVLAGLNPSEITTMVEIIRKIREQGVSIIMIEHVMHAIMNVSDRLIVLDYGQQIAEGTPDEIVNNPRVIEAYLGDPKMAERLMERTAEEEK